MTPLFPDALHFPPYKTIVSYLENHSLTKSEDRLNKKIIEAVAHVFADRHKSAENLSKWVWLVMRNLPQEIRPPNETIPLIAINFTHALRLCARANTSSFVSDT